jgi:hypothetical protein
VVQLDNNGNTVKTIPFKDGSEWTFDWDKARELCGKKNAILNRYRMKIQGIGGFEVVSEPYDQAIYSETICKVTRP